MCQKSRLPGYAVIFFCIVLRVSPKEARSPISFFVLGTPAKNWNCYGRKMMSHFTRKTMKNVKSKQNGTPTNQQRGLFSYNFASLVPTQKLKSSYLVNLCIHIFIHFRFQSDNLVTRAFPKSKDWKSVSIVMEKTKKEDFVKVHRNCIIPSWLTNLHPNIIGF